LIEIVWANFPKLAELQKMSCRLNRRHGKFNSCSSWFACKARSFPFAVFGFLRHNRCMKEKETVRYWRRFPLGLSLGLLTISTCSVVASFPFDSTRNLQCDFWQTSDGLPNHDVVSLVQTTNSYIWVGMVGLSNSLVRFNGFEFAPVVSLDAGDAKAVTCLATGKNGKLWISRSSGTGSLILWQQGKATLIETNLPPSLGLGVPLFEDRNSNLWIGGSGLLVRSPEGHIKDLSDLVKDYGEIRQIIEDKEGVVWLATGHGPVRYKNGAFDHPYPITNAVCSIYSSAEGSLWVGTDTEPGLLQITPTANIVQYGGAKGLKSRGVLSICEDQESNIWLGTYFGLYYIKDGKVNLIQETDLKTAFIFSLLWDNEDSLWVGTSDGLYHLYANPIEHYGAEDGLGAINSISMGPSGLWVNTFSRGTYLFRNGVWTKRTELGDSSGDGQLFESANGDLWIPEVNVYDHFRTGKSKIVEEISGSACFCDDGKILWIVNATNIFSFKDDKLALMGNGWPAMTITAVVTNRGGGLLIGTTQGLYKWAGQLTRWPDFVTNRISDLEWDGATLWMATDRTIARYQERWQMIDSDVDFLTKTGDINSMLVEGGSLWLGCVNGLFCISRAEAEQFLKGRLHQVNLTQYGKAQGMRSGYLGPTGWGQGAIRGNDGKLWFASKSGVVAVNTKELLNSKPPPVVIENVLLDQVPTMNFDAKPDEVIKVPAGTRNVEIHFAALTYISPAMVIYKYRLRGLDSDWAIVGNSHVARFSKLPPGNYDFEVQARNAGGVWNDEGANVHFSQQPFFHQTRAFYALCGVLGMSAMLGLTAVAFAFAHAISSQKMRRQVALLEAQRTLDRERARIARDIHDDVGSTLTRIVLLSELANREPEQTYTVDGHLAGIRSAAREITRRLDEIVWAINPRNDTLDALVTYISKLITDQSRAAGVHCRLEVPSDLPAWPISGSMRHNIFLACKEAIHNAIKHSAAKLLQLRLTIQEGSFLLEICDDGVGLPAAPHKSTGNGLLNMRERLINLGGTCEISSVPGNGTVVGFRLFDHQKQNVLSTK
jgi:signal transduction histidine kinase/ligand-binding sensor domain-containing protein